MDTLYVFQSPKLRNALSVMISFDGELEPACFRCNPKKSEYFASRQLFVKCPQTEFFVMESEG